MNCSNSRVYSNTDSCKIRLIKQKRNVWVNLSAGDVEHIYFACYFSNVSIYCCKIDQDRFLLKFMKISIPAPRKRTERNNLKPKSVETKHTVLNENDELVSVCAKYFTNIIGKLIFHFQQKMCSGCNIQSISDGGPIFFTYCWNAERTATRRSVNNTK